MKAVVAAFNQEKALVGAFSVITNLRMELFEALVEISRAVPRPHLLGHLLGGLAAGEPGPGVGCEAVGVTSDGEHDQGRGWHRALLLPPAARGCCHNKSFVIKTQKTLITLHPTELLESLGHPHGLRVDEGEEENVGAPLLVLVQPRLPVTVISVVTRQL